MKHKILRILAIIMICCVSLLCVGCMGNDPDDFEEGDGVGENAVIDMYGTKVLYRPNNYDYNHGSGAEEGKENNYYGKYAYSILSYLYDFYAIPSKSTIKSTFDLDEINDEDITDENYLTIIKNINYFYDSIRYQVNTIGLVTKTNNGDKIDPFIVVGADLSSHWKWSFNPDLSNFNSNYNALLIYKNETYPEYNSVYQNNMVYYQPSKDGFEYKINQKYGGTDFQNKFYLPSFLGTDKQDETEKYSDFVKALEYVVYSYALDLEPQRVDVKINQNPSSIDDLYTVQIGAYQATEDKSSAEVALADITALFEKIGSYVGLIERQINKISNWIKTNVIGLDENIKNDTFTEYKEVTAVYNEDKIVSFEFNETTAESVDLGRDYSNVVDKIVKKVCEKVTIGEDSSSGDVNIDERFLASEIKEYAGSTFMINSDKNFPKYQEGQSPVAIQPLEYQSAVIMLSKETAISDIWIALKYDADLDGTEEGVYDMSKYIDIIVELNYYNHKRNRFIQIDSQRTRVYDGPYEFGISSSDYPQYNLPDDHGVVMMSVDSKPELKDLLIDVPGDEGVLPIGVFNPDIGNGILKTDVGNNNYQSPVVSNNPIVLVGTTDVRKYYSIIEPTDDEIADPALTYITGRLNPKMFEGSDGCDYLEITYKVLKEKGNSTKNYKFYTGIAAIFNADT